MTRLTQRLSTMWSVVKCPRCGTMVQPDALTVGGAPPTPAAGGDEKRWSFLWTPPRGDFCPECEFPLSKYFGRLKWIRTMVVGVAIVLVALVVQTFGVMSHPGSTYVKVMKALVLVGTAVFVVGIAGVVIGGRHGRLRVTDLPRK